MAKAQNIECIKRDVKNKSYLKEHKRQDWIPGIVYGKGSAAQPIFLPARKFTKTLQVHGLRGLFSLVMEEGTKPAMTLIREIQKDPLSGKLIHVDFLTVSMDEKVNNQVSIQIIGEENILKKGALLQYNLKEVEVLCLPQDIPDTFVCDVSELEVGDKITVADLQMPETVELITEEETLIVTILAPDKVADGEDEEETAEQTEQAGDNSHE